MHQVILHLQDALQWVVLQVRHHTEQVHHDQATAQVEADQVTALQEEDLATADHEVVQVMEVDLVIVADDQATADVVVDTVEEAADQWAHESTSLSL